MKEVVSFETGKGRSKKTHVVCGEEIQARKDLSKENQGRRLAPKPRVTEEETIKPGSEQERWNVSTKYGIVDASYKPKEVIEDEIVVYKETEDQIIAGLK